MLKHGFMLIALFICFGVHAEIRQGDTPPDALGTATDGSTISVSSLHGKIVVISFWATWCHYCMKEMPILAGLQAQATEHHLPLQVIAIDSKESRETFIQSARLIKQRLPNLMLGWDQHGTVGRPYGADRFIPVMVMLHRDGTIAHIHAGYDESLLDTIVAEVNALLVEPAVLPKGGVPTAAQGTTAATR